MKAITKTNIENELVPFYLRPPAVSGITIGLDTYRPCQFANGDHLVRSSSLTNVLTFPQRRPTTNSNPDRLLHDALFPERSWWRQPPPPHEIWDSSFNSTPIPEKKSLIERYLSFAFGPRTPKGM